MALSSACLKLGGRIGGAFRATSVLLRKARVTIPKLSPTHTQAQIIRFCPSELQEQPDVYLECTNALMIVRCSPDIVTEGFREKEDDGITDVCPLMIVETHDEGLFELANGIQLDKWYDAGTTIGIIDDEDDEDDDEEEWMWQAYSYEEGNEDRELNLPPHIATGKISGPSVGGGNSDGN